MKRLSDKLLGFPWGIVSGVCAITAFYSLFAYIAVYIVLNGVAGQTNETISLFENWYLSLLFVVALITASAAIGTLVMFIIREVTYKREDKAAVSIESSEAVQADETVSAKDETPTEAPAESEVPVQEADVREASAESEAPAQETKVTEEPVAVAKPKKTAKLSPEERAAQLEEQAQKQEERAEAATQKAERLKEKAARVRSKSANKGGKK